MSLDPVNEVQSGAVIRPGALVHVCNTSPMEVTAALGLCEALSTNKQTASPLEPGMVAQTFNLSTQGAEAAEPQM